MNRTLYSINFSLKRHLKLALTLHHSRFPTCVLHVIHHAYMRVHLRTYYVWY